jgi:alcohol dehydrogenase YqhD (iron-dependent ADH family)
LNSFEWNFPTRIAYGKGNIEKTGSYCKEFGNKAFVVSYRRGGRSSWIVDKAISSLEKAGLSYEIFDAVEPNPRVSTVDEGARRFLESKSDFVLAVGGGSVIDAAKFISATAYSGGSAWDYVILAARKEKVYTGAFPIVAVPTVAAAGSEANAGGVITNWDTKEKSFARSPHRIPRIAIIDPEIYTSLPRDITADGGVDIFSHLLEHYLSSPDESEIADRITEGIILTLRENLAKTLENGKDTEARGQLALCSVIGWSGLQALGRTGSIPIHFIEHEFSGHFDISHGRGMAVIIPAYLEYFADAKPARWAKLARRVFGITENDDQAAAKMLHRKVREWFSEIGMNLRFLDLGIDSKNFASVVDDTMRMYGTLEGGKIPGSRPMSREDILKVLDLAK